MDPDKIVEHLTKLFQDSGDDVAQNLTRAVGDIPGLEGIALGDLVKKLTGAGSASNAQNAHDGDAHPWPAAENADDPGKKSSSLLGDLLGNLRAAGDSPADSPADARMVGMAHSLRFLSEVTGTPVDKLREAISNGTLKTTPGRRSMTFDGTAGDPAGMDPSEFADGGYTEGPFPVEQTVVVFETPLGKQVYRGLEEVVEKGAPRDEDTGAPYELIGTLDADA